MGINGSDILSKKTGNYLFWYWIGARYLLELDDEYLFIKDKKKLERVLRLWSHDLFIWEKDDFKGDLTEEPMAQMIEAVSITISKLRVFYRLFYGENKTIPELWGILFLEIIPSINQCTAFTFERSIDYFIAKNIWDYKRDIANDYLSNYPNKFLEDWVSGKKHRTRKK